METRLKIKITVVIIVFSTLFYSCRTSQPNGDLNNYYGIDIIAAVKMKNESEAAYFVRLYKTDVYYTCLSKNIKSPKIFGDKDLGFSNDFIPFPFWTKSDKISKEAIRYMDKSYYISDNPEDNKKERISLTCLNYLMSRELDSIAKNEYKVFKKMNYYKED